MTRVARRLVVLAVFGVVWLAFPAQARAQPNFAAYHNCLQTRIATLATVDPNDVRAYLDADVPLNAVWECSGQAAQTTLVPIGLNLLGAFALIIIVWTGLNFMFTGSFDVGQMLSTLLLIGFAFALLQNYYFATPVATPWGPSSGFPALVGQQAVQLTERLIGNGTEDFTNAYIAADNTLSQRQTDGFAALVGDPENLYREDLEDPDAPDASRLNAYDRFITSFMRRILAWSFSMLGKVFLWIIGWVIYAQYLWGFFALALLTLVGPLFIPFVVLSQLDFLFWGWCKALLQSAIYMITAGVLYVVSAAILVAPIQRLTTMPYPSEAGGLLATLEYMARLYFEFVPLVIMSVFAAFKVGTFSSGLMTGGTPPASGLGRAMESASRGLRDYAPGLAGWGQQGGQRGPAAGALLQARAAAGAASPVLSQRSAASRAAATVASRAGARPA